MKMLTFWAGLLLCGLLPSSQSTGGLPASSLVELDINALQNALGTSMGQDNLLGNLVGQVLGGGGGGGEGLLGNILGGGGGGGLLGNNGLLGTGLLGGNGGLLGGNGGLLGGNGGLLGGNEGLIGLKIVSASPLQLSLTVMPPNKIGISLSTNLKIKANLLGGQLLELDVAVNITGSSRLVQDPNQPARIVASDDCNVQIKLGSSLLSGLINTVSNVLNNALPAVLCPVLTLATGLLNGLIGTVDGVHPVEGVGSVEYLLGSILQSSGDKLMLDLDVGLLDSSGNKVPLPPMNSITLPPTRPGDHTSRVLLNTELISSLIDLHVKKGSFNRDITGEGSSSLAASALQSVLPEGTLPANSVLKVSINTGETPLVTVENTDINVKLPVDVTVSAQTDSGLVPLFAADADIDLKGRIKVTGDTVGVNLSLERLSVRVSSSQIGDIDANLLKDSLLNLLRNDYLPSLNGMLSNILPLPHFGNMDYASGAVGSAGNAISVDLLPVAAK
ncbi:BPI fold-containing family B member 3 [Pogona vitticeps]